MEKRTESIHEKLDEISNTLLLESSTTVDNDVCDGLIYRNQSDESNFLGITYSETAYDRLDVWEHDGRYPTNTTVIDVGARTRSAETDSSGTIDFPGDPFTVKTLADETDLVGLGQAILEELSEFTFNGKPTAVCFHSITGLLEYVDEETAFRFLHILTSRLESENVSAHYHMNSEAHDKKTLFMFSELFESVVRPDETGGWSLQSQ